MRGLTHMVGGRDSRSHFVRGKWLHVGNSQLQRGKKEKKSIYIQRAWSSDAGQFLNNFSLRRPISWRIWYENLIEQLCRHWILLRIYSYYFAWSMMNPTAIITLISKWLNPIWIIRYVSNCISDNSWEIIGLYCEYKRSREVGSKQQVPPMINSGTYDHDIVLDWIL